MRCGHHAVVDGVRERFVFEHARPSMDWTRGRIRLGGPLRSFDGGGTVVTYAEVTERRGAERDVQTSRDDVVQHDPRVDDGSVARAFESAVSAIGANAEAALQPARRLGCSAGGTCGRC
jgi:hypothetical protein